MNARPRRLSLWFEYILCVAVAAGLVWAAWYLYEFRYLPQPFFYEPWGTFMDWYSLTVWGHIPGAYDINGTIYPPLSFVLLRIFSVASCYPNFESEWARDCDPIGIIVLTTMVFVNAILTFLTFRKHDRECYIPRAFALSFGFPMMFTFERGNLLLLCYTAVLLAFGPLLKSARLRWFFAAVGVNFKVYLIGALVAPVLRRRWLQAEGMLLFAAVIYLVSWLILGEGSPQQIYHNVSSYVGGFGAGGFQDLWFPSSFVAAFSLLKGETFPITRVLDSRTIGILLLTITVYLRTTQLLIILAAIGTWLRPEAVTTPRAVFLAITLALSTNEGGGYTQILLLIFVFMEKWRGIARPLAITLGYMLCMTVEYTVYDLPPVTRYSWLANGGAPVVAYYGVGIIAFLRLFINYAIIAILATSTIWDVWIDIRKQGWKYRWRYHRDAPILPQVERPTPILNPSVSND